MDFIAICLALVFERSVAWPDKLRFSWYPKFLEWSLKQGSRLSIKVTVIFLLLLFPLLALIIHVILDRLGFLVDAAILWYCFGPVSLFRILQEYKHARDEQASTEVCQSIVQPLHPERSVPVTSVLQLDNWLRHKVFLALNRQIVAVIFWYSVTGVFGVVFYRMLDLYIARSDDARLAAVNNQLLRLQGLLDWITARILGFIYGVVGDFKATWKAWLLHAGKGVYSNETLLTSCADAAEGNPHPENESQTMQQLNQTRHFIDRATIGYVVFTWIVLWFS